MSEGDTYDVDEVGAGSMTVRPRVTDRPDSIIGGVIWDKQRQCIAVGSHAAAEGKEISIRTTLESYDRTLHPWIHGRRPADIAEKARGVFGL